MKENENWNTETSKMRAGFFFFFFFNGKNLVEFEYIVFRLIEPQWVFS